MRFNAQTRLHILLPVYPEFQTKSMESKGKDIWWEHLEHLGTLGNKGKREHLKQQSREQPQAVTGHHHRTTKTVKTVPKTTKSVT